MLNFASSADVESLIKCILSESMRCGRHCFYRTSFLMFKKTRHRHRIPEPRGKMCGDSFSGVYRYIRKTRNLSCDPTHSNSRNFFVKNDVLEDLNDGGSTVDWRSSNFPRRGVIQTSQWLEHVINVVVVVCRFCLLLAPQSPPPTSSAETFTPLNFPRFRSLNVPSATRSWHKRLASPSGSTALPNRGATVLISAQETCKIWVPSAICLNRRTRHQDGRKVHHLQHRRIQHVEWLRKLPECVPEHWDKHSEDDTECGVHEQDGPAAGDVAGLWNSEGAAAADPAVHAAAGQGHEPAAAGAGGPQAGEGQADQRVLGGPAQLPAGAEGRGRQGEGLGQAGQGCLGTRVGASAAAGPARQPDRAGIPPAARASAAAAELRHDGRASEPGDAARAGAGHQQARDARTSAEAQRTTAQQSDIQDVNSIFKDLATMVHDQGDMIDSIEANVESAAVHVDEGVQQVAKARQHQEKARKKMFCLLIIAAIVLATLITIIVVSTR